MIVVGHERVSVNLDAILSHALAQHVKEQKTMLGRKEDRLASGTSVHDMVPCAGIVDPRLSRHKEPLAVSQTNRRSFTAKCQVVRSDPIAARMKRTPSSPSKWASEVNKVACSKRAWA